MRYTREEVESILAEISFNKTDLEFELNSFLDLTFKYERCAEDVLREFGDTLPINQVNKLEEEVKEQNKLWDEVMNLLSEVSMRRSTEHLESLIDKFESED